MALKLELHSGKKLAYKLLSIGWPISFGYLVLCVLWSPLRPTIGIGWVVLIISGIADFGVVQSNIKLYHNRGSLYLAEGEVRINELIFSRINLTRVEVTLSGYRGQKKTNGRGITVADGGGNLIVFCLKAKPMPATATFLLWNDVQRDILGQLLRKWQEQGIEIIADGIDLDSYNPLE